MPNVAYDLVCDALSRIVSRRAAENMVSDALRGARLTVADVRPDQMKGLLKSVVFARLQQIIPIAQAKGEIRQILNALETQFSAPRAFSPEVEEGWLALRAEFARVPNQRLPRAQRLAAGIAQLPDSADPVRVLNDLWAELDLVQLEASPQANLPLPSTPRYPSDLLLESGEYASLQFEMEYPENSQVNAPALGRPRAGINQDLNLTIVDQPTTRAPTLDQVKQPTLDETKQSTEIKMPALRQFETPLPAPLELDFRALAIPDQPSQAVPSKVVPSKVVPKFRKALTFETPEAQENLLTRFALEEGVTGVLLSKRDGAVLLARLSSGSAAHLAGVVAATTMLLAKRHPFQVFYTNLGSVVAFIAPLEQQLLTVLAGPDVNVGRVFTELESLKESA